ncbi:MAG: DUF4350 domain-containing protein [Treponema sp.]|nr:DUF4350 domain-containing protein [Treponema sp.]
MKRDSIVGVSVTAAVLALLAFLAWYFLEIYPRQRWNPPSREARVNEYLALDRWLKEMGHSVRLVNSGNLSAVLAAEERQVFIQASLFSWASADAASLAQWVEEGGTLFVALDFQSEWEYRNAAGLLRLLEEFGIQPSKGSTVPWHRGDPETPAFGHDFSFEVLQDDALAIEDRTGITRLVRTERGEGRFIVSGRPRFLHSRFIGDAPNARLAWTLFAAGDERDWLFIRGTTRTQGLLGSLFRHGNFGVLAASALVLLVVGFWAVIPMFGLVRREAERPGKPLRERFIAEGRFLKAYGALGFYRDAYVKEIRRRLAKKEGLSTDDELIGHVFKAHGEREARLFAGALGKEPIKYREFLKMITILKTILERI